MQWQHYQKFLLICVFFMTGCASSDLTPIESRLDHQDEKLTTINEKLTTVQRILAEERMTPVGAEEVKSPPPSGDITTAYEEALALFEKRKYSEAAAALEILEKNATKTNLADNCRYWIGECYFGQKDYNKAMTAFETTLKNYPSTNKRADALLMIGQIYFLKKDYDNAIIVLEAVADDYPGTRQRRVAMNLIDRALSASDK